MASTQMEEVEEEKRDKKLSKEIGDIFAKDNAPPWAVTQAKLAAEQIAHLNLKVTKV